MATFSHRPRSAEEIRYQQMLEKAPSFVWKRFADGVALRVRMFAPAGHVPDAFAPAVLFFCGGMWAVENTAEFVSWAVHLSHRGIVCLLPEYRIPSYFDVTGAEIITDALDAWQWVHHNAAGLGIDETRITLAGSDAGGLMALNAAMQPMIHEKRWWEFNRQDVLPLQPSCVAIFRGVVDPEAPEARALNIMRDVQDPDSINPCCLLRRKLPPLFCAHGMQDPLLDYEMRDWFCEEWRKLGNEAELVLCPNGDHTLTHFEVNPAVFEQVLLGWETFMVSHNLWPESENGGFDALME